MNDVSQLCEVSEEKHTVAPESSWRPLALSLTVIAGLLRLAPHPWNLTPVGAACIFGGARLRGWRAFAVPLGIMAVSDLVLWATRHDAPFNPFVYASFALMVLLGRLVAQTNSPWRIPAVAALGSALFFLVTNFGAWLGLGHMYPRTLAGLWQCYVAAIPFAQNTFLGDLIYTPVLFLAHGLLARLYFPAERVQPRGATE